MLLCSLHFIASNNDVRAEPFLTGMIIAAVYHFSNSLKTFFSWHLVAATAFTAMAMMTKGPFTLVPIGGALAGQLLFKQDWKQLFHPRWLLMLVLLTVFISPELYSLWYQFDQHPEKIIFGGTNVSGIRFFLWDSQFGRFFNSGPIKGKGDPFFFFSVHLLCLLLGDSDVLRPCLQRSKLHLTGSQETNRNGIRFVVHCPPCSCFLSPDFNYHIIRISSFRFWRYSRQAL